MREEGSVAPAADEDSSDWGGCLEKLNPRMGSVPGPNSWLFEVTALPSTGSLQQHGALGVLELRGHSCK